jgi:hypothetical protein
MKSLGANIEISEFINPPTSGRDKGRLGILARVAGARGTLPA